MMSVNEKNSWQFDERQEGLRGQAFRHGYIAAIIVIIVRMVLASSGIVWAEAFTQELIWLFVLVTVVSCELHLRGAYFGRAMMRKFFMCIWCICTSITLALPIIDLCSGEPAIQNGMLTQNGGMIAIGLLMAANAACALARHLRHPER
ncbi:MAG: hypothetical protein LBH39_06780 [Clostridiales Family XIII bacterium]|nr:hypothetical protein [Clostridiales Family XIII bacterium]